MSGTSLDGVDAALVRLTGSPEAPRFRLLAFLTAPYPPEVQRRVLRAAAGRPAGVGEISQLNFLLGEFFAEAALRVCREARISPRRLAAIGSHGQTVFHRGVAQVEAGRRIKSTLQIAEPAVIAERTNVPVVANFRAADVAAGGQGAPLVPLIDYLLFRDQKQGSVALNIGGIANATVIPASAPPEGIFGFDTGPGNMIMDALARRLTQGRMLYDSGGRRAARGKILDDVLRRALRFPFFRQPPPKSAGREQFGKEFVARFFLNRRPRARPEDLLRTANELTARTIADALSRFVGPGSKVARLIVSGGGARNRVLLARIKELLPELELTLSDAWGVPADAKEALAFALLADRTLHGLSGNLPAVTGAGRAVVLGSVYRPGGKSRA